MLIATQRHTNTTHAYFQPQVCELLIASTALGMPIDPQVLNSVMNQLLAAGLNHVPIGGLVAALTGLSIQGLALSKPFLNTVAQVRWFAAACVVFAFGSECEGGGLNHVPAGGLVAALTRLSIQGVALSKPFLNTAQVGSAFCLQLRACAWACAGSITRPVAVAALTGPEGGDQQAAAEQTCTCLLCACVCAYPPPPCLPTHLPTQTRSPRSPVSCGAASAPAKRR